MIFGLLQKNKFRVDDGAYSLITDRGHYDSQITATDAEADLIVRYFGH